MRKTISLFPFRIFSTLCFMAQQSSMQHIIGQVREKHVPDSRKEIFDVVASQHSGTIVLSGETTSKAAYREMLVKAGETAGFVKNDIRLLPDGVVGEKCWGVVYNSVEKLYSGSSHGCEILSEVLLGMPVRLLDKTGGWRRVQTPEGYIGWVSGGIKTMTEAELREYNQKEKVVVTVLYAFSYEKADVKSQTISNLVIGDMLVLKGMKDSFYRIMYPDGREAYIRKSDSEEVKKWLVDKELTPESIVRTAQQFMGIPYVWGGVSSNGLDCSGLVKLVYFLHGVILQRDASQQVLTGEPVDDKGNFASLQPGDLLFFGTGVTKESPKKRVVHVAIYIGNRRFIHASDYVQIGSFDPADMLYDEHNTGRYLCSRTIIGGVNTAGIEEIPDNAFYKW